MNFETLQVNAWDERRNILIPGDQIATLEMCLRHFFSCYKQAIKDHHAFYVALSGGSTPKEVYRHLCQPPYSEQLDWNKIYLFWGDERKVPPTDAESNYKMAMDAGFKDMPIPKDHIFRMQAEKDIQQSAALYEKTLLQVLPNKSFDLVILGMGEDGHTASLFPHTEALHSKDCFVVANYIPQKDTWRMTLTFEAINQAKNIALYVMGSSKKYTLKEVFESEEQTDRYPVQAVGTKEHKALWIIDESAGSLLSKKLY